MAETLAPKFIYLQDGGNLEPLRADQYNEQVTWCEVSVEDNDTKYVRADLHEELERQLAAAQREARAFYALSEERRGIIEATRSQLETARQDAERFDYLKRNFVVVLAKNGVVTHAITLPDTDSLESGIDAIRALEGHT